MDVFFWFALVGFVAGWVTGKSMKCQSHSPWSDAAMGAVGGLLAGFPLRHLEANYNWGLLVAVLVATAGGVLVTWGVHRALEHFHHTAH
ncbi:GlsB/YeaQ/YmgE family stress response membrane protein [Granulicella sp. 5B5]|uniref:GlsB/YeaQ/YmgE family stress response membrane protein n=1 Tax=Granulicella sp. 5B5 TaxID=1617967 RepID=UPI0015F68A9A|nr:GlsB/YeaQ/YmgE family stress response membrane protein [Granulicella sp. 5B5]QMV18422.1 GlsB/YeaQ/YmgE family stress response membrane protein [Granulicella sp. 5B5]